MKRVKKSTAKRMVAPRKMAHNTTIGRKVGGRKATLPATGTKSRRAGSPPKRKLGSNTMKMKRY